MSLWPDGANDFAGESKLFDRFLAGSIACAKEFALFLAPTINFYKRYAAAGRRRSPRGGETTGVRPSGRAPRSAWRRGSRAAT